MQKKNTESLKINMTKTIIKNITIINNNNNNLQIYFITIKIWFFY